MKGTSRLAGFWGSEIGRKAEVLSLAVVSAVAMVVFVLWSRHVYGFGFPLDDAWIHQTYARNLASGLGWVYRPGIPSAGATAPLWVMLLAVGHLFRVLPLVWVWALGWATLTALGLLAVWGWRRLAPQSKRKLAFAAGLVLLTEWHMIWASLSGMETALFSLIVFAALLALTDSPPRWFTAAVLIAFGIWLRPEMVGVWGIAVLGWALTFYPKNLFSRQSLKALAVLVFVPSVGFGLLAAFNYHLSGTLWPNTFYAKQAEYAALLAQPLWKRWLREAAQPLVGVNAILVFGFLFCGWKSRFRQCGLPLLWALGHITVYALRLPVVYQHGRYLMPVVPVLGFWGLLGWAEGLERFSARVKWVAFRTLWASLGAAVLVFAALGANSYARDVAFIQSEMVDTALWGAEHLPQNTKVAIHDIGAWGYFTDFPIIDLAGLISPDVVPVIRSEEGLRKFINAHHAEVLVTFPDWYPHLVAGLQVLYFNPHGWGTKEGGTHMTVYHWK